MQEQKVEMHENSRSCTLSSNHSIKNHADKSTVKPKNTEKNTKGVFSKVKLFFRKKINPNNPLKCIVCKDPALLNKELIEEAIQKTSEHLNMFNAGLEKDPSSTSSPIDTVISYIDEITDIFQTVDREGADIAIPVLLIHKMRVDQAMNKNIAQIEEDIYAFLTGKTSSAKIDTSIYSKHLIENTLYPSTYFNKILSSNFYLVDAYMKLVHSIMDVLKISESFDNYTNILFCMKMIKEVKKELIKRIEEAHMPINKRDIELEESPFRIFRSMNSI